MSFSFRFKYFIMWSFWKWKNAGKESIICFLASLPEQEFSLDLVVYGGSFQFGRNSKADVFSSVHLSFNIPDHLQASDGIFTGPPI